jgi:hypothetical protein
MCGIFDIFSKARTPNYLRMPPLELQERNVPARP